MTQSSLPPRLAGPLLAMIRAGQEDRVLAGLRAAASGAADVARVEADYARLLSAAGRADEAAAHAAGAVASGIDSVALRLLLCEHHVARGEVAAAEPHFRAVASVMRRLLAADACDEALALEKEIYWTYIRQRETEEHSRAAHSEIVPALAVAGRRFGARFPPLGRRLPDGPPRLGFVLHNGVMLGHTELLLTVLKPVARSADRAVEPVVYLLGEAAPQFPERFGDAGIPVVEILRAVGGNAEPTRRLSALRARMEADRIDCAVWVSAPTWSAFALAMRIAPVQVFWSMKFHPVELPEIDGYVTLGDGLFERRRTVHGREWRCGPLLVDGLLEPADAAAVAAVRAVFPEGTVLLGTVARPEKLADPAFQDCVARLLRERPGTVYLWTGRTESPAVADAFCRLGVADRCRFVGWVDPRTYAAALDVFVEPFPFGCGVTGLNALAQGACILAMDIPDSAYGLTAWPALAGRRGDDATRGRLRGIFAPALADGRPLVAGSPEEYVALGLAMIDDPDLRRRRGDANAAFARAFLGDVEGTSAAFVAHFVEIVAEADRRAGVGAPAAGGEG
jgi:hypothetical protein